MDCSLPGSSVLGTHLAKIRVNPSLGDCVLSLRGATHAAETFGVASVKMIPKSRTPRVVCWQLLLWGSFRQPYSLLRSLAMETEQGCGWRGYPISAALTADFVPEVGVHSGLALSPLLSPLFPLLSPLFPLRPRSFLSCPRSFLSVPTLSSWCHLNFPSSFHPRISFALPGNCYSQISRTSPKTSLRSRLYLCSQDDSQKVGQREAQSSPLGLSYLDRRRSLRWAKVCFHYLIRRIFVTKTLLGDFSKEFLFLIFKLLFKFQYQIINRYNFSEHLQRGHLQDLALRTMCYYKELCHFERYFRPADQILAYFSWLNSTD